MYMESSSRKRGRDDDNSDILQPKKQDFSISFPDDIDDSLYKYEFHDGVGVFDFPWLKEGVIFSSETAASFEDQEDKFAPTSYLQDSSSVVADADINSSSSSSSYSSVQKQKQNQNQNENDKNVCEGKKEKKEDEEDDRFWSLVVDDLEPLDCIWSSVIDQPLDVGFHKG